ncbi:MAG: DNA polymerase IV, partial [Bacteroidota bacterium]
FLDDLPVNRFHGIGPETARKMNDLNIFTGKDLREADIKMLVRNFGKAGPVFYNFAHGIDERPVVAHRIRKSVGIENTFHQDLETPEEMWNSIKELEEGLWNRITRHGVFGKTLTLKLKYNDFEQITRSQTYPYLLNERKHIRNAAKDLLNLAGPEKPVRLLGISVTNLEQKDRAGPLQLTINFD